MAVRYWQRRFERSSTLSDLNMLLMNGGRERTKVEFEGLLAAAGFRLARVVATQTPIHILEAGAI